ncbi:MAG: tetratricopeptide repeat protein [Phycisphaerales bacterium]|nr:MAG: tetratricopeptide repeat protein [Phycisphaerales bacterium]
MRPSVWIFCCVVTAVGGMSAVVARGSVDHSDFSAELSRALADFDRGQQILDERPDRARQLFRSAAQRLSSIVSAGIVNGRLEYNLGNCYLQAGDVGEAILHYLRARRLMPRDPLLADNLAQARSRCLMTIQPTRRSAVLRNVFFWHYDTSLTSRSHAAIALYVVFWILLAIRAFMPRPGVTLSAVAALALTVILAGSVGLQHWVDQHAPGGVVTTMDVTVHKGPGTGYQRQFEQPLQPGVEFTLLEERPGWWNIELPDRKTGWTDSSAGKLITPLPTHAKLGGS